MDARRACVDSTQSFPPPARGRARPRGRPPWQRADATVAHLPGVEALVNERGTLVYRVSGELASLLQCDAPDADAARALVEALPPGTTGVRWLIGPAGHPLTEALGALSGTLAHRQHEMLLQL